MRIISVDDYEIKFDNGSRITYAHEVDCCEENYADFQQLEESALNYEFHEKSFKIIPCNYGFRFGDKSRTFFIPCYSIQNGYYSNDIDIIFNKDNIELYRIDTHCEVDENY